MKIKRFVRAVMKIGFLCLLCSFFCFTAFASTIHQDVDPPAQAVGQGISIQEGNKLEPVIVIGFVGGRVHPDNEVHREVQLARRLRQTYPQEAVIEVFANNQGKEAHREISHLLDCNHDGLLSAAEKRSARIVIYGHSWGASQTITLAQQLARDAIPVLLTVQVDSVSKFREHDGTIPNNVAQAVNFYQSNGLLHGRTTINAVDPARTRVLGNIRQDYKTRHVDCTGFPWYARVFMHPHIEIENDAQVWDQIEALIDTVITDAR